jgi:hypothetical protein
VPIIKPAQKYTYKAMTVQIHKNKSLSRKKTVIIWQEEKQYINKLLGQNPCTLNNVHKLTKNAKD